MADTKILYDISSGVTPRRQGMNKKTLLLLGRLHNKYNAPRLKFGLSDIQLRNQHCHPRFHLDLLGSKVTPSWDKLKIYMMKSTMETSTIFQHDIFARDTYASCRKARASL